MHEDVIDASEIGDTYFDWETNEVEENERGFGEYAHDCSIELLYGVCVR